MAPGSASTAAMLRDYLQQHPSVKLHVPEDADFRSIKECCILKPEAQPFAIAHPQSAEDVQALVRFCVHNDVDFVVRAGGHDTTGRSQVHDALTIDMRAFNSVIVDRASLTVRVGGGALHRDVSAELQKYGLVTPVGSIGSVGYTGWATLGGYGPFSPRLGPGVDQIISVQLVNPKGELIEAGEELLTGIRGGGGIFGIIVETTIKAFPLKEIVAGLLVVDPTDLAADWQAFATAYQSWRDDENDALPAELYIQPFGIPFPGAGNVFALGLTWTGSDHDEANRWINKVADALATGTGRPPIIKQAAPTSVFDYAEQNEKMLTYGVYGRVYPLNFRAYTAKTAAILARYNLSIPGSECGISIHSLRSPPANKSSVFGTRVDHNMLEVIALAKDRDAAEGPVAQWAEACIKELREMDPDNFMESTYVSLGSDADSDYRKIYGSQYERLVSLKTKYDPDNVFKFAVPKIASSK
ncbi:hypothetical protein SEUCBS139899_010347 [Sporothrix eucalyptigena]|uniref:FAD-binding PCMH-type domain-containing protein n=1 Tax=Sporothrix eucalyptigena TaxID=1812306 RepID=A0ABP0CJF4_9PEZI